MVGLVVGRVALGGVGLGSTHRYCVAMSTRG